MNSRFDVDTVDRLLDGRVKLDQLPREYRELAKALRAIRRPNSDNSLALEAPTVLAMAMIVRSDRVGNGSTHRRSRRTKGTRRFMKIKFAALAIAGALAGTTGLVFADALPQAAQEIVSKALIKVGVRVPNGGSPDESKPTFDKNRRDPQSEQHSKREQVEQAIANSDPGVDRGLEVSEVASEGHSNVPTKMPPSSGNSNAASGNGNNGNGGAANSSIGRVHKESEGAKANAGGAGNGNSDFGMSHHP